jgi:hypothetical protein
MRRNASYANKIPDLKSPIHLSNDGISAHPGVRASNMI